MTRVNREVKLFAIGLLFVPPNPLSNCCSVTHRNTMTAYKRSETTTYGN